MKTKTRQFIGWLGSGWVFAGTLLIFVAETGYLAVTSRFPMAYDEAYHLGLIQFYSHRLTPIITSQTANTYQYGALTHGTSFLYHYLMSFPYRLITLFTHDIELQAVSLRFINIALAVASLLVLRKFLQLMRLSKPLTNVIMLVFALTPAFAVLSAQINYDNLFILAVSTCLYLTVSLTRQLDKGVFDLKKLVSLLCLCLFSSTIKYAFLPIFMAIVVVIGWRIIFHWRRDITGLKAAFRKGFTSIGLRTKLLLLITTIVGGTMFSAVYGVNMVKYHTPVPQCDKILTVPDCEHYYAWENIHLIQIYDKAHPEVAYRVGGGVPYSIYWIMLNTYELFCAMVPLRGDIHTFGFYIAFVCYLGIGLVICTIIQLKKMLKENPDLSTLLIVSAVYLFILWVKNYHDYLRTGQTVAVHGRYVLPVLMCLYILLATGLRYTLARSRLTAPPIKAALALGVIVIFVYFGGFRQYVYFVDPLYGRLNSSNDFTLGLTEWIKE